ncbi:glycerol-3-phosphate O-acyltransferase [Geodermatophilus bullaregiensis]|uniref:glycerol-3-phosphate 1-O-acyltransferase n=1 Tax=Geodermatophilus bullaregiensis TaxID=1564160 RepID=UPI00195C33D2|nr:glycerol-3-phosphate 1-O-acyltransferase [Geodermatophilus bullaregiensis]MBM7805071.1 glycerol-3-phosphate O-acyltransferase [Geodermatophilus bullaregiensis]
MTPLVDTDVPLIVLVDADSEVERRLVAEALPAADGGTLTVLPLRDGTLAGPLSAAAPDTVVTAVRVAWAPRRAGGGQRSRTRRGRLQAAAPSLLRRPPAALQAAVLRRDPGRARVVVAEPATVAELSGRWDGTGSLAGFVAHQARLALDRAERGVVGDRVKVPRHVTEAIRYSPEFRREVAALAERLERPEEEVLAEAVRDLDGLVAAMDPVAIELFTGLLRPVHSRAWNVQVDAARLDGLRELNRRHPLVFLPSHRSYVDPLVLADVLAAHDFPRNHVLGGDNLRFWPVGPLAKRAGLVFIRRSFGDDQVYKLAVREYFAFLLAKRFNLEWYMEGGRSRTGKLRPPRHGLLRFVADAVEGGRVEDAYVVPVSITYDQLREVSGMAAEQGGAAKRGEGLSWMASYIREQVRTPLGTVHVGFAEPLSLAAALCSGADPADPDARRLTLQKVAFQVAVGINSVTPATATALVTLALLGVRDRALTLAQVQRVLEPLLAYLTERRLPHSGAALRTALGVRRVLGALAQQGVVTVYEGGEEPVYAIERGQHLVAAFYRNSAIHHVVDRAIAELVLLRDPVDRWDEASRLRKLLEFEFFFPERDAYRERLATELAQLDPQWETADGRDVLCRAPLLLAHRVLRSFVDAQLVVAERLAARDPRTPVVEGDFLAECSGVGQQMLLQGRLHGPESLSRELFASALRLAANLDLVDPGREELARRRQEWAAQVRDVVGRVGVIDELDAAARRESVGVEP